MILMLDCAIRKEEGRIKVKRDDRRTGKILSRLRNCADALWFSGVLSILINYLFNYYSFWLTGRCPLAAVVFMYQDPGAWASILVSEVRNCNRLQTDFSLGEKCLFWTGCPV
jgi:hypothetical protein